MSNRTKRRLLLIATAITGFAVILVILWLTNPGGPLAPLTGYDEAPLLNRGRGFVALRLRRSAEPRRRSR